MFRGVCRTKVGRGADTFSVRCACVRVSLWIAAMVEVYIWTEEETFRLLGHYEKHPILWKSRKDQTMRWNQLERKCAWEALSSEMGLPWEELKRKMTSLWCSFRREKSRMRKTKVVAKDGTVYFKYVSSWYAFEKMAFLLRKGASASSEPEKAGDTSLQKDAEHTSVDTSTEDIHRPIRRKGPPISQATLRLIENQQEEPMYKKLLPSQVNIGSTVMGVGKLSDILDLTADLLRGGGRIDECSNYGDHVANKLRAYDNTTRIVAEHHINNILFKADMGGFENTTGLPVPSDYPISNAPRPSGGLAIS